MFNLLDFLAACVKSELQAMASFIRRLVGNWEN